MSESAEAALVSRVQRTLRAYHELKKAATILDVSGEHALVILLMGDTALPLNQFRDRAFFSQSLSYCIKSLTERGYIERVREGPHAHDKRHHIIRRTLLGKELAIKLAAKLG